MPRIAETSGEGVARGRAGHCSVRGTAHKPSRSLPSRGSSRRAYGSAERPC